jgi:hypothetical protein
MLIFPTTSGRGALPDLEAAKEIFAIGLSSHLNAHVDERPRTERATP